MGDEKKLIEFELDGAKRQVPEGTSVLEAARRCGTEIPHFCYHPGLGVDGNCRLCLVEIEGARGLQISCNVPVGPGMIVRSQSPAARDARKATLELLLINHPIDCPICDQAGECKLQDYYAVVNPYDSRFTFAKVRKHKVEHIGADVMLDQERCVLCARCTRFFKNVAKDEQLVIANRGDRAVVTPFPGRPLDSPYSANVVDVCPVGALTNRDFRFKTRVWMLTSTPTVCTGCATGCNIWADHKDGVLYRFRPRENRDVNGFWICDEGRYGYRRVGEGRLLVARLGRRGADGGGRMADGGADAAWDAAVAAAAAGLREAGGPVAVLGSPALTTEACYVLRRLAEDVLKTPHRTGRSWRAPGTADAILRHAVKAPNVPGVALAGLVPGAGGRDVPDLFAAPHPAAWLIVGADPIGEAPDEATRAAATAALDAAKAVVVIASHASETTARATVLLPLADAMEQAGTMVSAKGRVQRLTETVVPRSDARPATEWLAALARASGGRVPEGDAAGLYESLRAESPVLASLPWDALGGGGLPLSAGAVPLP